MSILKKKYLKIRCVLETMNILVEYLWIDGYGKVRSKTRVEKFKENEK